LAQALDDWIGLNPSLAAKLSREATELASGRLQQSWGRLQGFEQMLTKLSACGDREVEIIRQVGHPVHRRDLAVEKIAHEKGP
jgi:hypothetical protein